MPVIARAAENIPGYDQQYPPFRLDEYNYHAIARSILDGTLYASHDAKEFPYPIGFPVVAAPFIALFGDIGGYLANLCILMGATLLFYLLARRYTGRNGSLLLTAVLAFATLNWFYATSCYTEPLSQLLVLGSFALVTGINSTVRRHAIALMCGAYSSDLLFSSDRITYCSPSHLVSTWRLIQLVRSGSTVRCCHLHWGLYRLWRSGLSGTAQSSVHHSRLSIQG
jgi:hypothetical protein